jgi:hypothetical protein
MTSRACGRWDFPQIAECGALKREFERPSSLGIRSRYVERPYVPSFREMLIDAQRCKGAAA